LGSQVSGVVETKVWTADKQPVALLAKKHDWIAQVIPQQAIKAIPVLSNRKMVVIRRQKLGWHFLLRRQVFTAVCCGAVSSRDSLYTNETVPIVHGIIS
jgi:hypothetical protein